MPPPTMADAASPQTQIAMLLAITMLLAMSIARQLWLSRPVWKTIKMDMRQKTVLGAPEKAY
jgi:hypothetical protein